MASPHDDGLVVEAPVELDAATSPDLRNQITMLLAVGAPGVVIDFARTTFVDSSGMGVLVALARRAAENGVPLSMRGFAPGVRQALEINGLHRVLPLDPPGPTTPG